ncbi:hypothetical protein Tco_0712776 [Tanacetum coccineum]
MTGNPRGFAFVSFSDASALNKVLADTHTILGRMESGLKAFNVNARPDPLKPSHVLYCSLLVVKGYNCKLAALSDAADYFVATVDADSIKFGLCAPWRGKLAKLAAMTAISSYPIAHLSEPQNNKIITLSVPFEQKVSLPEPRCPAASVGKLFKDRAWELVSFQALDAGVMLNKDHGNHPNETSRADYDSRYRMGPRTVGNVCRREVQVEATELVVVYNKTNNELAHRKECQGSVWYCMKDVLLAPNLIGRALENESALNVVSP